MNEKLIVPVPASVAAWYLVPATMEADRARGIALSRAGESIGRLIEYAECDLKVEVSSTVSSGENFRRPGWVSGQHRVSDRHLVSFRASARTGIPALHEDVARALAAEFASELKVPAIADAGAGQWISADEARASLHAKEDGNLRLSDWVRVAAVPDGENRTVSLETVGLRRYGLPELRAADVPSWFGDGWSVALTGLAWRLRAEFLETVFAATPAGELPLRTQAPATFGVPEQIRLSADDVASAYCLRGVSDPLGNTIGLRRDQEASGTFLTVRPPRDWDWGPEAFLESVADGPLRPVLKAARVFDDLVTGNTDLAEFALRF